MSADNRAPMPSERDDEKEQAQLPVVVPNSKFTIASNRLNGSAQCLNCGTGLMGPFCHYCGQPDKNLARFFPALLRELLEDFLDFDSRFMRTIKPLLLRPGKLTRDYLDGRRFRYVPPLRLYIFSSIACFFLAAMLSSDLVNVQAGDDVATGIHINEEDREDFREAMDELSRINPGLAEEITGKVEGADEPVPDAEEKMDDDINFNFNGEPWDRETNPLIIPLMPDWVNEWVNDEIAKSPQKGREIEKNPDLFKDKIYEVLPGTMFVLLPIVALLFKFWYLFAKKYYLEHLIFALHNHAFIFVAILLLLLTGTLGTWVDPSGEGNVSFAVGLFRAVVFCWIPLYLLISLKRVYQQGWGMTVLKYSAIGTSYLFLLALATLFVVLLSFVLL